MKHASWMVLAIMALTSMGCRRPGVPSQRPPAQATAAPAQDFAIVRASRPVELQRHGDDELWLGSTSVAGFPDPQDGTLARPHSAARLLWDQDWLYLSLYAADQAIEATGTGHDAPLWLHDAFSVRIAAEDPASPVYAIDIAPTATVTDVRVANSISDPSWESGIRVSVEVDGSVNDPAGEDDEEWVVYAAIPWRALGLVARPGLALRLELARCDVPRGDVRRCGRWGARLDGAMGLGGAVGRSAVLGRVVLGP